MLNETNRNSFSPSISLSLSVDIKFANLLDEQLVKAKLRGMTTRRRNLLVTLLRIRKKGLVIVKVLLKKIGLITSEQPYSTAQNS